MEISKGKLSLLHSVFCTWQSHTFLPLQPLPTTLGKGGWDKYQRYEPKNLEERSEYKRRGMGGNLGI